MTRSPRTSIIIPAYRCALTIERAVRSALAQTDRDLEVIVVEDASGDDTRSVLTHLTDELGDERLRLLLSDQNRGVSVARNEGLAAARGELVSFLDADDAYPPNRLEAMVALMGDDVDLVVGGRTVIGTDGTRREVGGPSIGSWTGIEAARLAIVDALTPFPWDKLYRGSLFADHKFPGEVRRFEDWAVNIVVAARARRVVVTRLSVVDYYIQPTSLTWARSPNPSEAAAVVEYVRANAPGPVTGQGRIEVFGTIVMTLLAQTALHRAQTDEQIGEVRRLIHTLRWSSIALTARNSPRFGVAAAVLKTAPGAYRALYRRFARRNYGIN